ncbi:hypothetical protein RAA17_11835 [Komagataeibacter rhaeticus]|nr:hypothetical protein [Komagataeibacter rhaeticus]
MQAIRHNPQGSMYDSMVEACHRYVASIAAETPIRWYWTLISLAPSSIIVTCSGTLSITG